MSQDATPPFIVVHIISGLGQGGAEAVLFRLVTASNPNAQHIVISMGGEDIYGERLRQAGITLYCLHMGGVLGLIPGFFKLRNLLKSLRPDVVQTWMYHADLIGGMAARSAGVKRIVWGIRNSGENLHKGSPKSRVVAWVCAKLSTRIPTAIVACAENAAQRHQAWGYDADRMVVIPNGYDLRRWKVPEGTREQMRHELGLSLEQPVIGAIARWNPLKDHANLLAAFSQVVKSVPDARCVLVGEGLSADNASVMALLEQHGLVDKVLLLGRRDDIPAIMVALDIHVLSSQAEGFPNVVCEAMAAGVSCVVTDVGDAASILAGTGVVVPPRNAKALAQGIIQVLGDVHSPERQKQRDQALVRVQQFGLDKMVQRYVTLWQDGVPQVEAECRLLMVVNNPAFFLSHRVQIAIEAKRQGYAVHIATMAGEAVQQIRALGFTHHALPMSRSGKNPLQELHTLYVLYRLFRKVKPAVVHAVTIKPVIYGGIAARLAKVPAFVAAVSGLGYVFINEQAGLVRKLAILLYRMALGHKNSRVIFQNTSDRDVLLQAKVVRQSQVVMIRGSGVELQKFPLQPSPPEPPVQVLMVARLLNDKGVREYVEAARLSGEAGDAIAWRIAGGPDAGNPASVSKAQMQQWHDQGIVQWLGERSDIPTLYAQSHIAVLPSYREGLPKSLVEAAAAGVPVVTTDVAGCRDAIEPGVSGVLVPVQNAKALWLAVQELANDKALREQMGQAGRQLAEEVFDVHKIVLQHLEVYKALGAVPTERPAPSPQRLEG
ncbi:glycosyltransferase [Paenalcaligenes sp. Me131]|uniref:glycosyltransferase n=1 Tax=Paenalcaligenes sp. Me131 TaxID=3392636 RepID=UPI003D2D0356